MIAGLLSNDEQNNLQTAPGLGDVPVLGNLFKSTSFAKNESELVIVVTPYLVNPVNANEIKLPTDGFNTPNELQRLLGNQLNGRGDRDRPKPLTAPEPGQPAGPVPQVGLLGAPVVTPGQVAAAQAAAAPRADDRSNRKKRKTARSNVGPGFSLN
jgi:pilus assembly protein CpaC